MRQATNQNQINYEDEDEDDRHGLAKAYCLRRDGGFRMKFWDTNCAFKLF
ncbi:MAG TPA: hypothetical protein VNZ64_21620 [Candidatus Acidoferrum sp.]|jgi:hypothetical protein|nr:hypothetical protein [Candidatus Acidoferrum sp.]